MWLCTSINGREEPGFIITKIASGFRWKSTAKFSGASTFSMISSTLRHSTRSIVFVLEERPSRVGQENLQIARIGAVHQKTGTDPGHRDHS